MEGVASIGSLRPCRSYQIPLARLAYHGRVQAWNLTDPFASCWDSPWGSLEACKVAIGTIPPPSWSSVASLGTCSSMGPLQPPSRLARVGLEAYSLAWKSASLEACTHYRTPSYRGRLTMVVWEPVVLLQVPYTPPRLGGVI